MSGENSTAAWPVLGGAEPTEEALHLQIEAPILRAPHMQRMNFLESAENELRHAAQKLHKIKACRVQQKQQALEGAASACCCVCCEQNNRYVIYDLNDKRMVKPLFYVQEQSRYWERNCLPIGCKPWRLDFHNVPPEGLRDGYDPTTYKKFLHIERPCSATCCCINRPHARIHEFPSNRMLGTLRDPFNPCMYTFQIRDAHGVETLRSSTCCCSVARFCPCPGTEMHFPVYDATDGADVATLNKTWMAGDCCPCCFEDWDNYSVFFGDATQSDYKFLLIGLATFVQMRYFDSRNQR